VAQVTQLWEVVLIFSQQTLTTYSQPTH
jgi:hypothetical protein